MKLDFLQSGRFDSIAELWRYNNRFGLAAVSEGKRPGSEYRLTPIEVVEACNKRGEGESVGDGVCVRELRSGKTLG